MLLMSNLQITSYHIFRTYIFNIIKLIFTLSFSIISTYSLDKIDEDGLEVLLIAEMPVISQTKFTESWISVPASVTVITQETIQDSGAINLTDLFRLVPGINIADLSAITKAISTRGFNSRFGNKLLVLIDGRTIYSPIFSGVVWEMYFPFLDNIERIEIIKGPGAITWGSNAVNGIINIITKKPSENNLYTIDTKIGTNDTYLAGTSLNISKNNFFANITLNYKEGDGNDEKIAKNGILSGHDSYKGYLGEVALEWNFDKYSFILRGGLQNSDMDEYVVLRGTDNRNLKSEFALFEISSKALNFKTYYFSENVEVENDLLNKIKTVDATCDYNYLWSEKLKTICGLGYRYYDYNTLLTSKTNDHFQITNAFIQNELYFTDNLSVIFGTKFENHDFTGIDYSPRISFQHRTKDTTYRISWAKAYRVPSIVENDFHFFFGMGHIIGNPNLNPESLDAYEIGYRTTNNDNISLDIALFHHDYKNLIGARPNFKFFPNFSLDFMIENFYQGKSDGIELDLKYIISEKWKLHFGFSYIDIEFEIDSFGYNYDHVIFRQESSSPKWQTIISNVFKLSKNINLTINGFYYSDSQWPYLLNGEMQVLDVDEYFRFDIRLAKLFKSGIELELIGNNLLEDEHIEGTADDGTPGYVSRFIYLGINFKH